MNVEEAIVSLEEGRSVDADKAAAYLLLESGTLENEELRKEICEVVLMRINEEKKDGYLYYGVGDIVAALVPYANEDKKVAEVVEKAITCDKGDIVGRVLRAIEKNRLGEEYVEEIVTALKNTASLYARENAARLLIHTDKLKDQEIRDEICEVALERINEKKKQYFYGGVGDIVAALVPYANEDKKVAEVVEKAITCDKGDIVGRVLRAIEKNRLGEEYVEEAILALKMRANENADEGIAKVLIASGVLKNGQRRKEICEVVLMRINLLYQSRIYGPYWGLGNLVAALVPYVKQGPVDGEKDLTIDQIIRRSITCAKTGVMVKALWAVKKNGLSKDYVEEAILALRIGMNDDVDRAAAKVLIASGKLKDQKIRRKICETVLKRMKEKTKQWYFVYGGVRDVVAALVPYAKDDEVVNGVVVAALKCKKRGIVEAVVDAIGEANLSKMYERELITVFKNAITTDLEEKIAEQLNLKRLEGTLAGNTIERRNGQKKGPKRGELLKE